MGKSNVSYKDFYVYVVFRLDGSPLYVGKGRAHRWQAYQAHTRAKINQHVRNIINQAAKLGRELPLVRIRENLTENEAFEIEKALIAAIGRKCRGDGPLVNLTDGGDGESGRHVTEEQRANIRAARARQPPPSEETKARTAKAMLGRKRGPQSEAQKAKISATKKANGDRPSPEHMQRLAEIHKGSTWSPERRAKVEAAFADPEVRARARAGAIKRWSQHRSTPGQLSLWDQPE